MVLCFDREAELVSVKAADGDNAGLKVYIAAEFPVEVPALVPSIKWED